MQAKRPPPATAASTYPWLRRENSSALAATAPPARTPQYQPERFLAKSHGQYTAATITMTPAAIRVQRERKIIFQRTVGVSRETGVSVRSSHGTTAATNSISRIHIA